MAQYDNNRYGGFLKVEESCIAVPFLLPSKGSDTSTSRLVYDEFPCHQFNACSKFLASSSSCINSLFNNFYFALNISL